MDICRRNYYLSSLSALTYSLFVDGGTLATVNAAQSGTHDDQDKL